MTNPNHNPNQNHNRNDGQRDEMLMHLSMLDFMQADIGLYLNTNPNDAQAIALHNTVARDAKTLRDTYEAQFGSLTSRVENTGDNWGWIDDPWPWEPLANFDIT